VPFNSGPPFGYNSLADVFGSHAISLRLASIGIPASETYFVEGQGHEFHGTSNGMWENGTGGNQYWDTIVQKSTRFFWQLHKPEAAFSISAHALELSFSDQSSGATGWHWNFGDGESSTEQNPVHVYSSPGNFLVKLYIRNDILSWDTVSHVVTVIDNTGFPEFLAGNIRIYPVPARGEVSIESDYPLTEPGIEVYTSSGKEMHVPLANIGKQYTMDLKGWTPGVFVIKIPTERGMLFRKLIVY
jgi:PKD repeat protein